VEAWRELETVLREARACLALPGNDFAWSSWPDASAALRKLDRHIAAIEARQLPSRLDLALLFAPTGPIQEVSFSGWADEFLTLAAKFDAVAEQVFAE
jgi:hypothetical protein